jgi:hypothetical protein
VRIIIPAAALLSTAAICHLTGAQLHSAVMIPAGTALRIRTVDPIDIRSAHPGSIFRGSLTDPVAGRNGILIPRGAPVRLAVISMKKSTRITGRDKIDLQVKSITLNGRDTPVITTTVEWKGTGKGRRTLKRAGIGAGAGALVGALAGGGTGAAVGALVGGGGGTAVAAATGGNHLAIPSETVFSFVLQSPVRLE